ncbi:MAG: hypothetical protein HC767_07760 [Akkermansiaceae bacterium]|nr:hypothetical protein [Akkermansiaceae bacterium]
MELVKRWSIGLSLSRLYRLGDCEAKSEHPNRIVILKNRDDLQCGRAPSHSLGRDMRIECSETSIVSSS